MEWIKPLVKSGESIIENMTPFKAHLLHMAVGIAGELLELQDSDSRENDLEELGDLNFFIYGALYSLDKPIRYVHYTGKYPLTEAVDLMKKHSIYNKPLDHDLLRAILISSINEVKRMATQRDLYYDDVVAHNKEKLLTGKNARYSSGGYSDQQAINRSDKNE